MDPIEKRALRAAIAKALAGLPAEMEDPNSVLAIHLKCARGHLLSAQKHVALRSHRVTLLAGDQRIGLHVFDDGSWKCTKKGVWRESIVELIFQKSYAPDPDMPEYVKHLFAAIQEGR